MRLSAKDKKRLVKLKERKRLMAISDNDLSTAWQEKKAKNSVHQIVELRDIKLRIF